MLHSQNHSTSSLHVYGMFYQLPSGWSIDDIFLSTRGAMLLNN